MFVFLLFNWFIFYFVRKKFPFTWFILFVTIIASIVVLIAPGNNTRVELFEDRFILKNGIIMTILGLGYYGWKWAPIIVICSFLMLSFLSQSNEFI